MPTIDPAPRALLPVIGFVWTESAGFGRRRILAAGAQSTNWADPAAPTTSFALSVRITAGLPTSEPVLRKGNPADPAQAAAQTEYLGKLQAIMSWLQTVGSNVTGANGAAPSRGDLLKVLLGMNADQVLVGVINGLDKLDGGTYYLVPRSSLTAPVAAAFAAAQQLAVALKP